MRPFPLPPTHFTNASRSTRQRQGRPNHPSRSLWDLIEQCNTFAANDKSKAHQHPFSHTVLTGISGLLLNGQGHLTAKAASGSPCYLTLPPKSHLSHPPAQFPFHLLTPPTCTPLVAARMRTMPRESEGASQPCGRPTNHFPFLPTQPDATRQQPMSEGRSGGW